MELRPNAPRRGATPEALNLQRFAEIIVALGPRRAGELAAILSEEIRGLPKTGTPIDDLKALIGRLHRLRGAAATLGMEGLAYELEGLEIALSEGASGAAQAEQVRSAHAAAAQAVSSTLSKTAEPHLGDRASR